MMTVGIGRGSSAILFLLVWVAVADLEVFTCYEDCVCNGIQINCSKSGLQNIPEFIDIKGANIVDLSVNEIEEVDYEEVRWKGIEQLQYLHLNNNNIVYIHDEAFAEFRNLEYLDLSNNLLEFLPSRIFLSNRKLTTLILAGNQFGHHTPKLYSTSITRLDLSFCKLETFNSASIKNLPKLQHLNLKANQLKHFPINEFNANKIEINLFYNNWACNCSTVDLYNWSKNKSIYIEDPIKCLSKHDIFYDLFKKAKLHLQKETCVIDPEIFQPSMRKYSQVTNATEPPKQKNPKLQGNNAKLIILVSTITFLMTATVSTTIGYILIRYIRKRSKTNERQGSEHLLMERQWL